MRAFAKAGRQRWRQQLTDIRELEDLPVVQEALEEFGPDVVPDANTRRDAIDAAIERAIARLPFPFSSAALEHFGIANNETAQAHRFKEAAAQLGVTTARWYDKNVYDAPYNGLKPREYVIRLVTYALVGVDDPVAYLHERDLAASAAPSDAGLNQLSECTAPAGAPAGARCIDVASGDGSRQLLAAQDGREDHQVRDSRHRVRQSCGDGSPGWSCRNGPQHHRQFGRPPLV